MAIARHWRLSANLDRWLPRLSLKDSDEPNGAGEDAPPTATSSGRWPRPSCRLPRCCAICHRRWRSTAAWPGILDYGPPGAFLRDVRHGWLRHEPAPNDLGSFDMPDPDVSPGTGVIKGIAPTLRAAAPRGVTVSVTGFEQVQAVGSSTGGVAPERVGRELDRRRGGACRAGARDRGRLLAVADHALAQGARSRPVQRRNDPAASPTAGRAAPPPARAWLNHRL